MKNTNIVFWSSAAGKSATSTNMLAVSTLTAVLYSLKTLLVQFDRVSKPIDKAFNNGKADNQLKEEFSFYNRKGMDEIMDKAKVEVLNLDTLRHNTVRIKHTNLYYMPSSKRSIYEFERETEGDFLTKFVDAINALGYQNYIDCQNGKNCLTDELFSIADVIVINLYQGMDGLEEILADKRVMEKAVFLIGRYDEASRENMNNIRRRYNLNKDVVATIPYNVHFHDAIDEGKLVRFMTKAIFCKKTDADYYFINEVYQATNMILRKAGYENI